MTGSGPLSIEAHCRNGAGLLPEAECRTLLGLISGWVMVSRTGPLSRAWSFRDFVTAIAFVNRVAELAEEENHHPDITVNYSRVRISLSTHDAGGVTMNDFVLARGVDALASEFKGRGVNG